MCRRIFRVGRVKVLSCTSLKRNGAAALCIFVTTPAFAGGFALEHQNAEALGAAFAGAEAKSSDAGFAAHNPAAIAGITGFDASLSATGVWPVATYSNADATLLGVAPVAGVAAGEDVIKDAIIPNLSLAFPATERLTLGLVANASFGFTTTFANDSVLRYQAQDSELRVIELTPVAAFELAPGVSVGAGLRVQYLDLSLTSAIDAGGVAAASLIPGFAPGGSDLGAAFDATNFAVGYSAGLQANLTPRLHAGLSYMSKVEHTIDGDARFDLAGSAAGQTLNAVAGLFSADRFSTRMTMPAIAALGLRFDATDRFTLLASTKLMRWSSFDVITLNFNDGATPPETVTQNWRDAWSFSLGGEYAASDATTLRAGVMVDETPVNSAFASPRIPDGDRHWFSAGLTQKVNEHLSADLGVAYAFFSDRQIAISGAAAEDLFRGSLNADFETEAYAVSLRLRYKY